MENRDILIDTNIIIDFCANKTNSKLIYGGFKKLIITVSYQL